MFVLSVAHSILILSKAVHRITWIFSKENIFETGTWEYFILAVR